MMNSLKVEMLFAAASLAAGLLAAASAADEPQIPDVFKNSAWNEAGDEVPPLPETWEDIHGWKCVVVSDQTHIDGLKILHCTNAFGLTVVVWCNPWLDPWKNSPLCQQWHPYENYYSFGKIRLQELDWFPLGPDPACAPMRNETPSGFSGLVTANWPRVSYFSSACKSGLLVPTFDLLISEIDKLIAQENSPAGGLWMEQDNSKFMHGYGVWNDLLSITTAGSKVSHGGMSSFEKNVIVPMFDSTSAGGDVLSMPIHKALW